MSAYARELLKDCVNGKADISVRVDLYTTIYMLYNKKIITKQHLYIVDLYLSGFSITEIEQYYENVSDILYMFFCNLAEYSGYTDEVFVDKYRFKYQKLRRDVLISAMKKYSKEL